MLQAEQLDAHGETIQRQLLNICLRARCVHPASLDSEAPLGPWPVRSLTLPLSAASSHSPAAADTTSTATSAREAALRNLAARAFRRGVCGCLGGGGGGGWVQRAAYEMLAQRNA